MKKWRTEDRLEGRGVTESSTHGKAGFDRIAIEERKERKGKEEEIRRYYY
mgnify:FL=1